MATHAAWSLVALLGLASPAFAGECRLALVLAVDVSSSVDATEHRLQRHGLGRALVAPEVVQAFLAGGPVALYVFEWNSPSTQAPIPPGWQMVRTEEDLARLAATLATHPRGGIHDPHHSTGLGTALSFAANQLQDGPQCRVRTVDVSGDGTSNHGFSPAFVFEHYPFEGVRVNALVIGGAEDEAELVAWFEAEVLHGPGAFLVVANGYEDYERAMRVKLLRELELPIASGSPRAGPAG